MRLALAFAALVSWLSLHPALAQEGGSARPRVEPSTRVPEKPAAVTKPAANETEKAAAEARARNEAKEKVWDEKMKRTMRSICSGVQGC